MDSNICHQQSIIEIRPMLPQDVDGAVKCFVEHYDVFDCPATVAAFLHQDPDSFFVAVRKDPFDPTKDEVIGACGCPVGPQETAVFGLYGVRTDFQNQGIGSKLFKKCSDYIGNRNSGLYAVPKMLQKYIDRSGFKIKAGFSMVNFVGTPIKPKPVSPSPEYRVVTLTARQCEPSLLNSIVAFDMKTHKETREKLLKFVLENEHYTTCVALETGSDKVIGYGCMREHTHTGRMYLGPLYAQNEKIAKAVSYSLVNYCWDKVLVAGMCWNALDCCPEGIQLAISIGLTEVERCERLLTERSVDIDYRLIYSVFSPDFSL